MGSFKGKYIVTIIAGILFIVLSITNDIASQPRFYASVDSPEIEAGSLFNLSFVLENAEGKDFKPPSFNGFDQVTGPSRLSSASIINGVSSSKLSFSYRILINKPGEYTIQPASIMVGNKLFRTQDLKIRVTEPKKIDLSSVGPDTRFFIRADVSSKTPYTGQQVLLQYKLYTRERVEGIRYELKPEFRDFKFEEIDMRFPEQRTTINNIEYTVYTINSIALFPLKTGSLHIPPATYRIDLPDRTSGNIFFRSTIPHSVSSEGITLEVKELPENAPEHFSGQAGQFRLRTTISSSEQIVDEAFTVLLEIESDAFGSTITAPDLRGKIEGFDIYDAKLAGSSQTFISGKLNSANIFEYIFVPKTDGPQYISIPYTYFDTEQGRYNTTWSDTMEIIVRAKGTLEVKTLSPNPDMSLKPSVADLNLRKNRKPFFNSLIHRIILGGLFILTLTLFLAKQRINKLKKTDKNTIAAAKAKKIALKRLGNAKILMIQSEKTGFISEIYNTLIRYVSDKLSLPKSELTSDSININLYEAGVPEKLISDYIQIIRGLEAALFGISDSIEMESIYEKSVELISKIEQEIRQIKK